MIRIKKSLLTRASIGIVLTLLAAAACTLGGGSAATEEPTQSIETLPPPPAPDSDLPKAPEVLGADHIAVFDVTVDWQDLSENEDGFNIYRIRTDIQGEDEPVMAGTVDENVTRFHDTDTFCGATYQYIIASFNEAGESPATACWQITLPPCQVEQNVTLNSGTGNAYNFLARAPGTPGDFYMNIAEDGRVVFVADQSGQLGLFDFGATDETPLHRITLPDAPTYEQAGVQVMAGERYVAQATDGSSLVLFDVNGLGAAADITYTVWPDSGPINSAACTYVGLPGLDGFGLPTGTPYSNICISGDGVCDPTCVAPPEDAYDVPVSDLPELVLEPPEGASPGRGIDPGMGDAIGACRTEVEASFPDPSTWDMETHRAAMAAFSACMEGRGYPALGPSAPEEGPPRLIIGDGDGELVPPAPTYTDIDRDCASLACVPDDGICVPACGGIALYPSSEGWNPPVCVDTNGNGLYDLCATINEDPDSPYFRQNRNWHVSDGDCGGSDIPDQPNQPGGQCGINPADGICCTSAGESYANSPNECPAPQAACGSVCNSNADCAGLGVNPVCASGFCYDAGACEPDKPPSSNDQPGGGGSSSSCDCVQVCTEWSYVAYPSTCVQYGYRDCNGNVCQP